MALSTKPDAATSCWKWRLRLVLTASAVLILLDGMAVSLGFSLRKSVEESTWFEGLIFFLNFPGILPLWLLGNPLGDPLDQSVQHWNLFCFLAGGLASWVLVAFCIGGIVDRKRTAASEDTGVSRRV